jgi:glycerol-3-phosphate dehydrogenase (NAD(P)+)
MKKISIVGGGVWGRALAQSFSNRHEILLYSLPGSILDFKNPKVKISYELSDLKDTKYLFLVVPTNAVREASRNIKPFIDDDCKIIICTKGIEPETGLLMSEIIGEFFPKNNIAILAGPNFASEVLDGLPSLTSIIADDISIAEELAKEFTTENFKLTPATNIIMAQIFGSIKNLLAILCGVARGLELGENFIASLVTIGVKEMMNLATHKNAKEESLLLEPAGIGDIFLTCSSTTSRNNKFGVELVTKYLGKNYQEIFAINPVTVEGVSTILALRKWEVNSPLLQFAYDVITSEYKNKKEIANNLQAATIKSDYR